MPQKIAIFKQENESWSDKNKVYKTNILDKFHGHRVIKVYKAARNIDEIPVPTCMEYYCVFEALFDYVQKKHKKYDIEIDVSGFTKEAYGAALNVAACFDNVEVFYARSTKSDIYTVERYGTGTERSGPEKVVPVPRVAIGNLENGDSRHYRVFRAVYDAHLKQCKRVNPSEQPIIFSSNLVKDCLREEEKKKPELEKIPPGTPLQLLRTFRSTGLIRMESVSERAYDIEMTPFGIGLARALGLGKT